MDAVTSSLRNSAITEPDFEIICKLDDGDNEQHSFKVHSQVLKRNAVFNVMLDTGLDEQREKKMLIVGWNKQTVEKFIDFLYDNRLDSVNMDENDAKKLLKLAHKYMLQPLMEACGEILSTSFKQRQTTENMLELFDLAVKYNVKSLKMKCQAEFAKAVSSFDVEQLSYILKYGQELRVLADACEQQLMGTIGTENVAEMLLLAHEMSCFALYNKCSLFIGMNWLELDSKLQGLPSTHLRSALENLNHRFAPSVLRRCPTCDEQYLLGGKCGCKTPACIGCMHEAHYSACTDYNVHIQNKVIAYDAEMNPDDWEHITHHLPCHFTVRYRTNGTFCSGFEVPRELR